MAGKEKRKGRNAFYEAGFNGRFYGEELIRVPKTISDMPSQKLLQSRALYSSHIKKIYINIDIAITIIIVEMLKI